MLGVVRYCTRRVYSMVSPTHNKWGLNVTKDEHDDNKAIQHRKALLLVLGGGVLGPIPDLRLVSFL